MNVFAYLRVSGRSQLEGDGFERQDEKIHAFCDSNRLTYVGNFQEKAVSGTVEGLDRPAFSELLEYVETRRHSPGTCVGAIVVERMDRIARDLMISEVLLAECRKHGLQVFSADQGTVINMAADGLGVDPTRILIRQIMGALAQWDKTMTVNKLRAARDRIKARGERCEGTKPFGQNPSETATLNIINICKDHTNLALATFLNSEGRTMRNGKPWTRQAVRQLRERQKQKEKQQQRREKE